ncbi:helix-turn-helix domain-containing protein [Kitasatospora indigofera]|uniref:helix-turn-helix domain-containing protein n=1 Tax=Kitasatospora indigofera TaxID=67307 RepID=UPI0036B68389
MVNRKVLDPTSSPWAPFGVQLRRSREALGLTQAQLAKQLGYDHTSVCYIELAKRAPTAKFARLADEALQTGGTLVLMWWQHKHTALIEGFPEFAEHEARATEIRLFEIGLVPGLLQTPAYAAADLAGPVSRGEITAEQAEERLNFRLARQQILQRPQAPQMYVALDESVIRWQLGGPGVLSNQLRHLEELAELPNVIIQVVPFTMGALRSLPSAVTLLTLPDQSRLAYTETLHRGFLERDRETVAKWGRRYDRLQVDAPTQAASVDMIRAARRDLAT